MLCKSAKGGETSEEGPAINAQTDEVSSRFLKLVIHAIYLPFPSLADTERAGEDSLGLLAEGGPDSRTLSAIFLTKLKKKKKLL